MSSTSSTSELFAWEEQTVGDLFDLEGGFAFKSSEFLEDGVPVIKIKNVKSGFFSKHDFSFVSEHFLTARPQKVARQSDLLISMSGNRHDGSPETWVGKVAYFDAPEKYLINQRVGALRVKDARKADPRFFSYLLSSLTYQELFIAIATSSGGQANLSPSQILSAPVYFPKLAEQQRIAYILGTLDDKIELNRRMAATLEEMARALFKSWFVDFDPVRAKAEGRPTGLPPDIDALFPDELMESVLGQIPKGWRTGNVSAIGRVICGKTPLTADRTNYGEDIPFITIPDMHEQVFAIKTSKCLSTKGAESQPKKTVPPGAIAVSCIATPGLVTIVDRPSQTNQQINTVVPHDLLESFYWYYSLSGLGNEIRAAGSGGSVLTNLSTSRFSELTVLFPNAPLRVQYHDLVSPFLLRLRDTMQQIQALSRIRDTLLPKLMSGEMKISEIENFAEGMNL